MPLLLALPPVPMELMSAVACSTAAAPPVATRPAAFGDPSREQPEQTSLTDRRGRAPASSSHWALAPLLCCCMLCCELCAWSMHGGRCVRCERVGNWGVMVRDIYMSLARYLRLFLVSLLVLRSWNIVFYIYFLPLVFLFQISWPFSLVFIN
jgi:hypothetical protein